MSKRVLVADGCRERARPIREALTAGGYTVVSAASGAECFQEVAAARPDLIVLEAAMPIVDGVEALQVLRDCPDTRELPVIVLGDDDGSREHAPAWSAEADMHLLRPISPQAVVAAAKWLLHQPARWPRT